MAEQDEIAAERVALRDVREKFGKKVGRDCDEWMCPRNVDDGPLFRVNPRGRPGIFMCAEHAAVTNQGEAMTADEYEHSKIPAGNDCGNIRCEICGDGDDSEW